MKRNTFLILGVALALIAGITGWLVETDGGQVAVRDVRFVGTNGTVMSALLYVPRTATAKTPAPGILAVRGYINSRETQSGFAIELARRGYVVLALDQTGHVSDPPQKPAENQASANAGFVHLASALYITGTSSVLFAGESL
jgi:dienelactone hydrolase